MGFGRPAPETFTPSGRAKKQVPSRHALRRASTAWRAARCTPARTASVAAPRNARRAATALSSTKASASKSTTVSNMECQRDQRVLAATPRNQNQARLNGTLVAVLMPSHLERSFLVFRALHKSTRWCSSAIFVLIVLCESPSCDAVPHSVHAPGAGVGCQAKAFPGASRGQKEDQEPAGRRKGFLFQGAGPSNTRLPRHEFGCPALL